MKPPTHRWHALPALRSPGKSGRTADLDHLLFAEQCTDETISSNKWVGLNLLSIYLFCPHFFSFGLRCQSTLPWWWIYEGLGKLELNMCIFCKLRHHIKGNSKSSVNSYQPTSVCFSVQLSKCAVPCVLLELSWADARLHLTSLKKPNWHVHSYRAGWHLSLVQSFNVPLTQRSVTSWLGQAWNASGFSILLGH